MAHKLLVGALLHKWVEVVFFSLPADQLQRALDEPICPTERHAKQDLQCQASLIRRLTKLLLLTPLAVLRWRSNHLRIKSDQQRSVLPQAVVAGRSIIDPSFRAPNCSYPQLSHQTICATTALETELRVLAIDHS
jgi:hypothetical protein